MKTNSKILITTAVAAAAVTWYLLNKKKSARKMLQDISDEGYETASDILYPGRTFSNELRYGPVIPQ